MTDLNKMFQEFTEMVFDENDVVVLPIRSLTDCCPNEILRERMRYLEELDELCDCEKKDLSCNECWKRASKIIMIDYFGRGDLKDESKNNEKTTQKNQECRKRN